MSSSTSTGTLANALRISAGFFLASALFDVLSEYIYSATLSYMWLVVKFLALAVFVWLLYVGRKLNKQAEGNLSGAIGCIIIMIIIDIFLYAGIIIGWDFVYYGYGGIILLFISDILTAIGFTLAYSGFKKLDESMSNPIYLLYGWGGLLFQILYLVVSYGAADIIDQAEFWVMLILLMLIAIMQFVKAGQVSQISPVYAAAAPSVYTLYQPYQQTYQPSTTQTPVYQEQQLVQPMSKGKKFCENCGTQLELDAKFCTNCGSSV